MASEQFSLCWDNFHKNMSSGMNSLLESEDLVDVTIAVEGRYLKAHKMVLSVCSPYFRELFKVTPCKHPIVFLKDVSYVAMSDLLQFMYQGEVQVSQENLTTFIKTAEALQIKGLTGDGNGSGEGDAESHEDSRPVEPEVPKPRPKKMQQQQHQMQSTPAPKRPRLEQTAPVTPTISTKTEPVAAMTTAAAATAASTAAPSNEQLIQFKMEPYDQGHSSVSLPDDNPDDNFTDDAVDEGNADDTNEDYSMMEGGDEEPQAGTSTDGTAGEGQGTIYFDVAVKNPKIILDGYDYLIYRKLPNKTVWTCSQYYTTFKQNRCKTKVTTIGREALVEGLHNHEPRLIQYTGMMSQVVTVRRVTK